MVKKIGILGDIGSGKSYVAKLFGYPVFNADQEVLKIYKNNKTIFFKLKKIWLRITANLKTGHTGNHSPASGGHDAVC